MGIEEKALKVFGNVTISMGIFALGGMSWVSQRWKMQLNPDQVKPLVSHRVLSSVSIWELEIRLFLQ
jgi:hypothetical protein